ncbi:RF-1 domain-containing protein [Suillus fuscotomentosus]|uniref:RF-1 domain-containing protein n=1 Tax=Suillus fuscotomentosus TaxID=1912939 RepID=A0AAD4HSK2_9AGAM|nr:RF-1 domain-containing protein [Suillus fuscotomentosus]KAG1906014.1 RF-1 domain-containing protein [Suillus fuscotomentosus]
MSVTPAIRAAARSAYRDLLRASASTFHGDEPIQRAFRRNMRTEALYLDNSAQYDVKLVEEKIRLACELATMLRRNVVQARRTQTQDGDDAWKLRFTKDTELGENESIKNPPPMPSSRQARRLEKGGQRFISSSKSLQWVTKLTYSVEPAAQPSPNLPRNFSALRRAHKDREIPELREEDIEESFVRGSGPGGQSINKTQNNVQLLHKPTGFRVACQETRSLQTNRMLARRWLLQKLDKLHNPGLSKGELQRAKQQERERQRRKKSKKKASAREGLPGK